MNRYKFLRVDETEIELFDTFLEKSAEQGWHPVSHWTSFFGILKFSKDISKSANYTVLFNQTVTGAQLKLNKKQTKRESDEKFKVFLEEFNVELVMTYGKFDILYSKTRNDVFTDKESQNIIITNYIKKLSVSFLLLAVFYAIVLLLFIFNTKFTDFFSSMNFFRLMLYSLILIMYSVKFIKGIQYRKGRVKYNKKKWESNKTDSMSLFSPIVIIIILLFFTFQFIASSNQINILFIPICIFIFIVCAYFSERVNQSKSTHESKVINSFLVVILAVIAFILSVHYSSNEKSIFTYSNVPFDLNLTECIQTPNIETSHSFFIQEYSISCDDDYVSVYKIKSPIYKKYFRDGAIGELGIDEYTLNNMNEGELTFINGKTIPVYVYVKENLIVYTISQDNQLFFKLINNLE